MKKFLVSVISIFSVLVTLAGIIVALSALLKHHKCKCRDEDEAFDYGADFDDLDDDFDTEYYTVNSKEEDPVSSISRTEQPEGRASEEDQPDTGSAPSDVQIKTDLDDLLEDFDEEEDSLKF
ncbi:hypothetical protein [Candidatus Soleaferrea massiliensis]|uniref:hypothetical protein n=1 Tax=Candidatus Soleaferrea massiliensis TaxID=1470354 RepID=UPI00059154E7|nr:hypothetical protein [Candidatus Soleaferrea massiliensis]